MVKRLRLGAQDGSVAAEYVGFGAVIAAVIVVLFAFDPSLADRLRSPVDDQVCKVLRADCQGEDLPADDKVADRGGGGTVPGGLRRTGAPADAASGDGSAGGGSGGDGSGGSGAQPAGGVRPGGSGVVEGAVRGVADGARELADELAGLLDQGAASDADTADGKPPAERSVAAGDDGGDLAGLPLPSAHLGEQALDGTTDDWFHRKREVAAALHDTLGSDNVGLLERGWHVTRGVLNAPVSALAAGYSVLNGGSCSSSPGLILSCTGQTQRSYWGSDTFQVGNVTLSSLPRLDTPLQRHETRHADQWALLGPGLFLLWYGAESVRTRRRPWRNWFERDAGLEDGRYI